MSDKTIDEILYACRIGLTIPDNKNNEFSEIVDHKDKYVIKAKSELKSLFISALEEIIETIDKFDRTASQKQMVYMQRNRQAKVIERIFNTEEK